MEYVFIYLLQLFDTLEYIKITTGVILFIGAAFYVMGKCTYISNENYYKDLKLMYEKVLNKVFMLFLSVFLITLFVPTRNTLLLMGGTYYGKKAVKQIVTDKKIEKVNTIIELELDKRIKELKGSI